MEGSFDRVFDRCAAVLIRPDRIVFGATDAQTSASDLVRLAAEKIALTPDERNAG